MNKTSKVPVTSRQAFQLLGSLPTGHHTRILFAMKVLSVPSSMSKIAEKAGMDAVQIARRMNELELEGRVEKAGKGLSATNRPCALYRIVSPSAMMEVKEREPHEATICLQPTLF